MEKKWIDPNTIYLAKPMNPRPMNQGFIESLVESMHQQGFLPQYPVKVFEAAALTCLEMDGLPYACVSGMHRTTAAQIAKIDQILCEVHTGDDDAFIEMMMTDNFEYDPARNSELGQTFSQREKRKACTRLLYMPKFFKMTNTALSEAWHTGTTNIRRWRKDVLDALEKASPNGEGVAPDGGGEPTFPETLARVGITPVHLNELRELNASREREDADGNTVKVRKPRPDASEDDKENFFETIRKDFHDLLEVDDDEVIDFDWDAVKRYAAQKWNVEAGWYMYKNVHIDQLRHLHKLVIEQDADFIEACTAIYTEAAAASKLREDLEKACKKTTRLFCKLVGADHEYDQKFKSKWKTFEDIVKSQLNIEMFGNTRWDYNDMETADERRAVIEQHKTVQEAIAKEADWIAEFMKKEQAAAAQRRKAVSESWTAKRDAAIAAINDYPRDISFDRIISAAEKKLYKSHGYFNKIFDAETVSPRKNIGTLEDEVASMDRLIKAVKKDADWVAEIPAVKVHDTMVSPAQTGAETAETLDKHVDRLIDANNLVNAAIVDGEIPWFSDAYDKQDFAILCDRAADVLACDRDILWVVLYEEDLPAEPAEFGISNIVKWDTILRQIHDAIRSKSDWIMAAPSDDEETPPVETPDSELEPVYSISPDDLHQISLEDIFQHVADRVIYVDGICDENEVMADMATLLGKASRGQRGTQLYLLMKFALFLHPKSDIEGVEIEKEAAG